MSNETAPAPDSPLVPSAAKPASDNRQGITRRAFMRYTGIGVGSLVLANPLAAFADEGTGSTSEAPAGDEQAVPIADGSSVPADITEMFDFGGSDRAEFVFHESFFDGSSFDYSNQMGTFGLCLALASFGANDDMAKYTDSPNHAISFLRDKLQCSDVSINDYYTAPTEHDSIGLICGHRPITADGTDYELVMMGIRGANYFYEWCGNLEAGKEGDHEGFSTVANKALDFLKDYLQQSVPNTKPLKILVAGFSRASATANMLGGLMTRYAWNNKLPESDANHSDITNTGYILGSTSVDGPEYLFKDFDVYQKDVYVYGYEVPAGAWSGGTVDADALKYWSDNHQMNPFGNIHSIVNPCDLIPKVMPSQWVFGRHGVDHMLPRPSDSGYSAARDAMLVRADAINSSYRSKYPVDSFDHLSMSMDSFFNTMIDRLVNDLTGSRPTYYRDYQQPFVDLVQYMQSGKIYRIEKVGSSALFKAWFWTEIILDVLGDILVLGLWALIKLAWKIIDGSLIADMLESTVAKLRLLDLEWGDEEENLYQELHRICPMIQKFAVHNIKLFCAMVGAFVKDSNTMEVHSSTLCLAWMQSYDPNYGDESASASLAAVDDAEDAEDVSAPVAYRMVLFDGDVTVWVAAETTYVKLFESHHRVDNADFPYRYGLNEDFQMFVQVPHTSTFTFKIQSDPQDAFSITCMRYEVGKGVPTKVLSYNAIGDNLETMYAIVGNGEFWVSTSEYLRDRYDYAVEIDNTDGAAQMHCNVEVSSADESMGLAIGGGCSIYGTSSMLGAAPNDGYEFDYWTVNGEVDENPIRSGEAVEDDGTTTTVAAYPFYVSKDYGKSVQVVAHFRKADDEPAETPASESAPTTAAANNAAKTESSKTTTAKTGDGATAAAVVAGVAAAGAAAAAGLSFSQADEA